MVESACFPPLFPYFLYQWSIPTPLFKFIIFKLLLYVYFYGLAIAIASCIPVRGWIKGKKQDNMVVITQVITKLLPG